MNKEIETSEFVALIDKAIENNREIRELVLQLKSQMEQKNVP